jgi:glucose-1-phosphate cytidylyltransferase
VRFISNILWDYGGQKKVMKVVILAGGFGVRLSEETHLKPKPMVEIGGRPILWHIMNLYAASGFNEFIIALGYKADIIKNYFLNYYSLNSDLTVDLGTGATTIHSGPERPDWRVHLVDTGLGTQTGGRLKRLEPWLCNEEEFMFTYGDGVADLDLNEVLRFHHSHGRIATVTTVPSPSRFGRIGFEGGRVLDFCEKPEATEGWINGGFFVLRNEVFRYLDSDDTVWEKRPIESLTRDGELWGYRHHGFWSCMDTLKEKNMLEEMWASGRAPWKVRRELSLVHA